MKMEYKFPIGAFEELATKYGSVGEAMGKFRSFKGLQGLDADTLNLIIDLAYVGGKWKDKKSTREDVKMSLFMEDLPDLVKAISKALGLALPEPTGGEPGNPLEA